MKINHDPIFNTEVIEEIYSKQDGVPVTYVCTSELETSNVPMDIFYRETPHPEFGNRYFGILNRSGKNLITNADAVEEFDFGMVESKRGLIYSSYRHDCRIDETAAGKQVMIDGGRDYVRSMGPVRRFKVKDGEFVEDTSEE